jgi:hypothetical protein
MAIFGLPGGAEWLVIGGTVLLLFFPGALLVWLGFVLGRRSAAATASDAETASDAVPVDSAEAPVSDAETEETPEANDGD